MTDRPFPDEPEKTTAEREAEARERARSAMATQTPEQKTPPGQPEVTRFRKASGHRTLIVSLLSLALVIALASGGDRLLSALKRGDEKEADTAPPPSTGATQHERKNLGMDSNLFGLFGQRKQQGTDPASQTVTSAPALPAEPPALNKAAALADGLNSGSTTAGGNARASRSEPRNRAGMSESPPVSTAYTSCRSVLVRGADGRLRCPDPAAPETAQDTVDSDNPGVARVTGVRRLGLDPDLYIPVDRYIPCSMMRRFVSDVGGHISCLIGEDVWSASNHVKLIAAGTVARGVYRTGALQHGRSRMFVLWTERAHAGARQPANSAHRYAGHRPARRGGDCGLDRQPFLGAFRQRPDAEYRAGRGGSGVRGRTGERPQYRLHRKHPRRHGGNGENDAGKQHQYPAHDVPEPG
ncbi:MAG: hypothetical protein ACFWT4_24395 [Citrobacter braakii]|jgi:type IV secretion system protein VirB10